MDFPTDFDVLVIGTSMVETMVASSLSVVGSSVLLIDRNAHYGGLLSSLGYPAIKSYINGTDSWAASRESSSNFSQPDSCHNIVGFEEKWFLDDSVNLIESSGESSNLVYSDESQLLLNVLPGYDSNQTSHENTEELSSISGISQDRATFEIVQPEDLSNSEHDQSHSRQSLKRISPVSKAAVLRSLRHAELDIMPKMLLCDSANMNATLRSDIARYMTFKFVNSLLAYCSTSNSQQIHGQPDYGTVEIPLCRKDIFTSKILSLRQKRTLGSFLEWCFNLDQDNDQTYLENKDKELKTLLAEKFNQDEFTQKIIINNIAMFPLTVNVEQAVKKLRELLFSMNRFGPFPLLIPMYGSADFPMAYSRLAAVFAATTCLEVGYEDIALNDNPKETNNRRYKVKLTNGVTVFTNHVVLGIDHVHRSLKDPHLTRWMLRGVFTVVGNLSSESQKCHQVSLLPFPDLTHADLCEDSIPYVIQTPFESTQGGTHSLNFCQGCVIAKKRVNSVSAVFQQVVKSLFAEAIGNGDSKKPRLLHAFYFQFPLFDHVPSDLLQKHRPGFEHVYVAPSPDGGLTLDSCVPHAEAIFRSIYESKFGQTSTTQEAEEHPTEVQAKTTDEFTSLHKIWDGIYPPKPPKPEDFYEEMVSVEMTENPIEVRPLNNQNSDDDDKKTKKAVCNQEENS